MLEAIIISLITGMVLGGTLVLVIVGLMIGAHKGIDDLEDDWEGLQETMETWQPIGDRIKAWWIKIRSKKQASKPVVEIKEITPEAAQFIRSNRVPLGLFYAQDGTNFLAIDNSSGEAWIMRFRNLRACKKWLQN